MCVAASEGQLPHPGTGECRGDAARVVRAQHIMGQGRSRRRLPLFGFKGVEDMTVFHTAALVDKETLANSH